MKVALLGHPEQGRNVPQDRETYALSGEQT